MKNYPAVFKAIKPYARAIKFGLLYRAALCTAGRRAADENVPLSPSPTFVIGCGRSGTTILGNLLMQHPQVEYLFEPYHYWAAIEPCTDILNLYTQVKPRLLLDVEDVSEPVRVRFNRLFIRRRRGSKSRYLVEKTPLNAMRIGYLDALAPACKFVHIVRDGGDVSRSIANLSTSNTYRIAGKPALNQWWGVADVKWRTLRQEGAEAGYFRAEVGRIDDDQIGRGAYEWLVSLREVDRWRARLGDRLLEISYENLTLQPHDTLGSICSFLGIEAGTSWLEKSVTQLWQRRENRHPAIRLPSAMAEAFNVFQAQFGFETRA